MTTLLLTQQHTTRGFTHPGQRLTREDLYFSCQIPISCMVVSGRARGQPVRQPRITSPTVFSCSTRPCRQPHVVLQVFCEEMFSSPRCPIAVLVRQAEMIPYHQSYKGRLTHGNIDSSNNRITTIGPPVFCRFAPSQKDLVGRNGRKWMVRAMKHRRVSRCRIAQPLHKLGSSSPIRIGKKYWSITTYCCINAPEHFPVSR
jgi:hypothetical protein